MTRYPARCLNCGYVLTGLPDPRCPECGRPFDPGDASTYSTRPLFVWWQYWVPGFLLAAIPGILLYLLLLYMAGWGVAVTLVAPFCVGAIVGYGCRVGPFLKVLLALAVVVVIVVTLFSLSLVGIFCGTALAVVALTPAVVGAGCGALLRAILKDSWFEQRWYLPAMSLLLAPLIWGAIEGATASPRAIETVATSVEIPAQIGRTWNAIMFYEEVRQRPPWLLRYGLPRPLYARGSTGQVGDTKTCVYTKGHLTKRVTRREPGKLLAFDVVQQDRIEVHSVKLTGGSFNLIDEHDRTRVELSTSYQPKLGPRWVWPPFEHLAVHELHRFVLKGMAESAVTNARNDVAAAPGAATGRNELAQEAAR